MMNLGLAVFWLLLVIGLVLLPQGAPLNIEGTGIPLAWVAVFFCCYNVLRWWLSRLHKRDRAVMKQIAQRPRPHMEERNPDFDFGDDAVNK